VFSGILIWTDRKVDLLHFHRFRWIARLCPKLFLYASRPPAGEAESVFGLTYRDNGNYDVLPADHEMSV
jgi:hypothetical protein